jgi:hypothetical protein
VRETRLRCRPLHDERRKEKDGRRARVSIARQEEEEGQRTEQLLLLLQELFQERLLLEEQLISLQRSSRQRRVERLVLVLRTVVRRRGVNVSIRRFGASLDLLRLGRAARTTASGDGSVVNGSVATLDAFDGRSNAAGELESVTLLLALLVLERNLALAIVLIVIRRVPSAPQRSVAKRTSTTTLFLRLRTRFGT